VVGVADDAPTAQRALEAASASGFAQSDLWQAQGEDAAASSQERDKQRNPVSQAYASIARVVTDHGAMEEDYLEEADQGRILVGIHAVGPEQVQRAVELLKGHNLRRVKYLGHWIHQDFTRD
jgi:hypothetical protein